MPKLTSISRDMGSAASGKILKRKNGNLTNFERFNENEIFHAQRGHNKASICVINYQIFFEKIATKS